MAYHPLSLPSARFALIVNYRQRLERGERIVDLTALEPGDLLLFRPIDPTSDKISLRIFEAQNKILPARHAQWTHAAVYLGDDEHICEANFKVPGVPNGVNVRSAFCCCDGKHAIRARRPRNMDAKSRLRIAIGALTNLGSRYSFEQILAFSTAVRGTGAFWKSFQRVPRSQTQAFVCSTLYQDAYNFAFQGSGIRLGTRSTPAHLSASGDFEDDEPPLQGLQIE
jgi:cell wall-associated NlpC family hydrolase